MNIYEVQSDFMFQNFYFTLQSLIFSRIKQKFCLLYTGFELFVCYWVMDDVRLSDALEQGENLESGKIYVGDRRNKS